MTGERVDGPPLGGIPQESCDVLVVGSGAGGLSAAVTAAHHGLRVIVAEKEPVFGGTTAWSGGWLWIPRNRHAVSAGIVEDADAPRTYLRHELGNGFEAAKVDAFLAEGPRMVDFFEDNTEVRFIPGNAVPDFHGRSPGAVTGGRSVCAAPYDGRRLGALIGKLRPPLRELTVFGMGIASGADLKHFLNAARVPASALHAARRLGRHALDLARHRRGMQLVNGNALVARLLRSAADAGVALREATPAVRLLVRDGRVSGAVLRGPAGERAVEARRGVVLAAGGFPHDPRRQAAMFAHVAEGGGAHHSAAPPTNTGDGLRLGEQAGGRVVRDFASPGRLGARVPRAASRRHPRELPAPDRAGQARRHRRDRRGTALRERGRLLPRLHARAVRRGRAGARGLRLAGLRPSLPAALRPRLRQAIPVSARPRAAQRLPEARQDAGGTGAGLRHRPRRPPRHPRRLEPPRAGGAGPGVRPRRHALRARAGRRGPRAQPLRRARSSAAPSTP